MPEFVKKFVTDFLEGGLAALLALNVAIPSNLDEVRALGLSIAVALLHALISAARREAPDALAWFLSKIGAKSA